MQTHTGVAAQMFAALAHAGVNIGMITTSDIKISVLVDRSQARAALAAVHGGFDLHRERPALPPVGMAQPEESEESDRAREERARDVVARLANMEDIVVSEVQLDRHQALVTLRSVPDVPGAAAVVFAENAEAGVMVDMIVQNVGLSGHSNISFTVPKDELERSLAATREAIVQWPAAVLNHEKNIAKLSVRGIGLRTHTGVGEKMFRALAEANVNVRMISTSEVCISTVVELDRGEEALRCLDAAFGLTPAKK
jgi:aspartate kinase